MKTQDPQPKSNVVAILLAAGRSRRMGAFKPLLPFGEKTVIRACIDNLRAGGVADIVVVVGHRFDEIKDHLRDLPVRFAVNPEPDSEMAVSITCGAENVPDDTGAIIVAPGDHPAVDGEVTRLIIQRWREGARLVVPEYNQRGGHPVLLDYGFRNELLRLRQAGGLRSLFQTHKDLVSRAPVESPYIARDLDTWDDYIALHREFFGKPPIIRFPGTPESELERD